MSRRLTVEAREALSAAQRGTGRTWTDEQLAEALRSIAIDGRVTQKMCRDRYEAGIGTSARFPSPMAYEIRWGSWNAAVEACGLTHGQARREYERLSLDRLADDVAEAMTALAACPTVADYVQFNRDHPELACCALIRRRFGGWPEALSAARAKLGGGPA